MTNWVQPGSCPPISMTHMYYLSWNNWFQCTVCNEIQCTTGIVYWYELQKGLVQNTANCFLYMNSCKCVSNRLECMVFCFLIIDVHWPHYLSIFSSVSSSVWVNKILTVIHSKMSANQTPLFWIGSPFIWKYHRSRSARNIYICILHSKLTNQLVAVSVLFNYWRSGAATLWLTSTSPVILSIPLNTQFSSCHLPQVYLRRPNWLLSIFTLIPCPPITMGCWFR